MAKRRIHIGPCIAEVLDDARVKSDDSAQPFGLLVGTETLYVEHADTARLTDAQVLRAVLKYWNVGA